MQVKRMQREENGAGGGEKVRYMGPKVTNGAGYVQLHAPESVSPNVTQEERREKQREREKDTNFFSPPPHCRTHDSDGEKENRKIFLASLDFPRLSFLDGSMGGNFDRDR